MIKLFIILVYFFGFLYFMGTLKKDKYLKFCCIALLLLMGLRHELCFIDTPKYVDEFLAIAKMPLGVILNDIAKDPFFWIVSSIIGKVFGVNYTVWLLICSLPFVVGIYRLFKNYSENIFLSFSVFLGLGFFVFLFSGIRQTVSLGFIILSLSYILETKYKNFVICTLIATLFHKTSLIFLIMWFLTFVKIDKRTILVYVVILISLMSVSSIFLKDFIFLQVVDFDQRFSDYEDDTSRLTNMGLYKQLFLFCTSLLILWNQKRSKSEDLLINAAAVGILLQSMSASIAEMFRLSMYFSIANTILLTIAIKRVHNTGNSKTLSIGIPLLVLAYILVANSNTGWNLDYHFFFENITSVN